MHPVLFEVGGRPVGSFGVLLTLGIVVGIVVAMDGFDRARLPAGKAAWVLLIAAVAGLLGARAWAVAEAVARDPSLSQYGVGALFRSQGLTWFGGLVSGVATLLVGYRLAGLPLGVAMDATAPGLAVGQAIGRIGCLLVGDDYGRATDLWVGMAFPEGAPPTTELVHPTQIYESVWLFGVAAWLWHRRGRSPSVFGEYLVLAGVGRIVVELFRTNPPFLGPLTNAQTVSLVAVAVGLALLWRARPPSPAEA